MPYEAAAGWPFQTYLDYTGRESIFDRTATLEIRTALRHRSWGLDDRQNCIFIVMLISFSDRPSLWWPSIEKPLPRLNAIEPKVPTDAEAANQYADTMRYQAAREPFFIISRDDVEPGGENALLSLSLPSRSAIPSSSTTAAQIISTLSRPISSHLISLCYVPLHPILTA